MKILRLWFAFVTVAIVGVAQDRPNLKLLAHALGAGVQECAFDAHGRRMVSVGVLGDLACWDAGTMRVLSRCQLPNKYVLQLAVHPTKSLAIVGTMSRGRRGASVCSLDRVDLESGKRTHVSDQQVRAVAFDDDGEHLAVVVQIDGLVKVEVFAGEHLDTPVLSRQIAGKRWSHAVFDSRRAALVVSGRKQGHCRIPLHGSGITLGKDAIAGFDDEGAAIALGSYSQERSMARHGSQTASFDKKTGSVSRQAAGQEVATWKRRQCWSFPSITP